MKCTRHPQRYIPEGEFCDACLCEARWIAIRTQANDAHYADAGEAEDATLAFWPAVLIWLSAVAGLGLTAGALIWAGKLL